MRRQIVSTMYNNKHDDVVNDGGTGGLCVHNVLAAMNDGNYRG